MYGEQPMVETPKNCELLVSPAILGRHRKALVTARSEALVGKVAAPDLRLVKCFSGTSAWADAR